MIPKTLAASEVRKLEAAIKTDLERDFANVHLKEVRIVEDVDWEGDEILKIEVVFAGTPKDVEPRFFTSAIRRIRPALSKHNIVAFPSMSFVSASDAKALAS